MKVKFTPLERIYDSERGSNYALDTGEYMSFLITKRLEGSVSGDHSHPGKTREKNPEVMHLLDGEIVFAWREDGEDCARKLDEPTRIEISAGTWHKITALTDIVILEEGRLSQEDYEEDTERST
ncbi:MAG: hypothetical protein GF416_06760 [Candidatus Altiarchaeales archaeon]|nr:hypothetical protein [Candidatus Altiarchaeales archaeon]MBD3416814.1 hypothetical protein [Candidatus Altiarchaeales archaeon]